MRISDLNFRAILDHYGIVLKNDNGVKGKGICPFHDDHDPSCQFDFSRNLYYCFVCSEGGSIINFVMKKEETDYGGAVQWLSSFFGEHLELAGVHYHSQTMQEARAIVEKKLSSKAFAVVLEHFPALRPILKERGIDNLIQEEYKSLLKKKQMDSDRAKHPNKWLWMDMRDQIEDYLWCLECAWRDRLPWEKLARLKAAHVANDEEGYFSLWDEELDSFATEHCLLKEVWRITDRLIYRAKINMESESKRLVDQGKMALIDWLGLVKAMTDGKLLERTGPIMETGAKYG